MGDLSTLDATQPPDTEALSQGASRIREERLALLTSFAIEHALTGEHKFLSGSFSSLPAPGHAGRIYFETDDKQIFFDNGTAWVLFGGSVRRVQANGHQSVSGSNAGEGVVATLPALVSHGGPVWVHGNLGLNVLITNLLNDVNELAGKAIIRLYENVNGAGFGTAGVDFVGEWRQDVRMSMPTSGYFVTQTVPARANPIWSVGYPFSWEGHWRAPTLGQSVVWELRVTTDTPGILVQTSTYPGIMFAEEYPG